MDVLFCGWMRCYHYHQHHLLHHYHDPLPLAWSFWVDPVWFTGHWSQYLTALLGSETVATVLLYCAQHRKPFVLYFSCHWVVRTIVVLYSVTGL